MSSATASIARCWSGVSRWAKLPLELAGQLVVGREGEADGGRARLVERDQLAGHLAHGGPGARLHPVPRLAAELRERRRRAVGADVAGDAVELVVRDVEAVAVGEGEREVVARQPGDGPRLEAGEAADAVVLVDDVVADLEVEEAGQALAHHRAALRRRAAAAQDRAPRG